MKYSPCMSEDRDEPLCNEVLSITNYFLLLDQNHSKMYGYSKTYVEPRFNEILVITSTIQKCKHKFAST